MKKIAALLLMAVAMASTAQASLEVRSTIADSEGYYTMSLVNAETGEVVDQKRFQYQLDDTGVDYIIVGVDEASSGEGQADANHSADGAGIPNVTDPSGTSDDSSSDATNLSTEEEEVGVWGSVRNSLDSIRDKLQESLKKLEDIYESRQDSGDIPTETLEVPEEVFEYTEEEMEDPKS